MDQKTPSGKAKTNLFPVNLNEGFLVDAVSNTIYGVYQDHHKAIVTAAPWSTQDFEIPERMKDYTVHNRIVGHFSIYGWTQKGDFAISDLVKPLTKREKIFEQL